MGNELGEKVHELVEKGTGFSCCGRTNAEVCQKKIESVSWRNLKLQYTRDCPVKAWNQILVEGANFGKTNLM